MLTALTLKEILIDLDSTQEIGCTYNIKERFAVGLKPIELLKYVKIIRTRVPKCGDHCNNYANCNWISTFEKRKSIAKFKLTPEGKKIIALIKKKQFSEKEFIGLLKEEVKENSLVAKILSFLKNKEKITVDELLIYLLEKAKYKLYTLRISLRDLLDFLQSIELIAIKEGIISTFV